MKQDIFAYFLQIFFNYRFKVGYQNSMATTQAFLFLAIGRTGKIVHFSVSCHALNRQMIAAVSAVEQSRKHIQLIVFCADAFYFSHLLHRFKSFLIYNRFLCITVDYPIFLGQTNLLFCFIGFYCRLKIYCMSRVCRLA